MRRGLPLLIVLSLAVAGPACEDDAPLFDFDGDGTVDSEDCAPEDPLVHPGADEIGEACEDGLDNDCDGDVDGDDSECNGAGVDNDGDGWTGPDGDCDDQDASVHPGADEVHCDGVDNDCDEATADGDDLDGDGSLHCDDCDDGEASVHPDADEICGDQLDNDCDGTDNGCRLAGEYLLADADVVLVGEEGQDEAGYAVASAGDVDGDGLDEFLIGAPGFDDRGAAYLVDDPSQTPLDLSAATARWRGEQLQSWTASAVASAGDVNGDGLDDVLVGASHLDGYQGAVYLVLTPLPGSGELADVATRVLGPDAGLTYFGASLAGGADVSGDGAADVLVGAPSVAGNRGAAYLFLDAGDVATVDDALVFDGIGPGNEAGHAVALGGDVDGDGVGDLLISAVYAGSGAVYLQHGPISEGGFLDEADVTLDDAGVDAGWSIALDGDLDGDGHDDVLVGGFAGFNGAPPGGLFVEYGPITGHVPLGVEADAIATGQDPDDSAGAAVAYAGDVDGDGLDDVLVGAPQYLPGGADGSSGRTYLLYGPLSGTIALADADAILDGSAGHDEAGCSVAGAGDVDGDGYADFLVGAHGADGGGSLSGEVYLWYGSPGL
jgi:hypothetical protein